MSHNHLDPCLIEGDTSSLSRLHGGEDSEASSDSLIHGYNDTCNDQEVHEFVRTLPGEMPLDHPMQEHGLDHLLRSLPDFHKVNRHPTVDTPKHIRTRSEVSIKPHKTASKTNLLFPSSWFPLHNKRKQLQPQKTPQYSIEYSVFRPMAHMLCICNDIDMKRHLVRVLENDGYNIEAGEWPENDMGTKRFTEMVNSIVYDAENDRDLKPLRIRQGSSGSYFILGKNFHPANGDESNIDEIYKRGVFKPKDEEPYGPLSPKWSKWLHRTFFPCFFGRLCLIPNLGYISEAAACVLDQQLMLFIVPYTDIVHIRSDLFYYTFWERTRRRIRYKLGSLQCFLSCYVQADVFLKQHPFPQKNLEHVPDDTFHLCHENDTLAPRFFWSKSLICQFQDELEKLVALDYIMRNTDRGADNWMIKVEWDCVQYDGILRKMSAKLRLGAIDSGLAFPWKHPDEWRLFPFGWLFLPYYIIGRPFSRKTRHHFLPLLTSKHWWEQTVTRLKSVFQKDADFKERMWHKQLAVLKGQAFNVVEALKIPHAGPLELIRREKLLIWDDSMNVPLEVRNGTLSRAIESSIYGLSLVPDAGPPLLETTALLDAAEALSGQAAENCTDTALGAAHKDRHMSGFDYNMKLEDRACLCEEGEETNTKTVVIERLEKVSSKRPVFTWC